MLLLAGDTGGTKTILRLVKLTDAGKRTARDGEGTSPSVSSSFETIYQAQYPSASYPDLVPIVQEFLAAAQKPTPQTACFAIAGPVVNNTSKLTNLSWYLDSQRLERELDIPKVSLINDFAAVSYGVLGLKDTDIFTLQAGKPQQNSPISVIGAGTGLGEGFLVPQGGNYLICATEGGHSDFAPRSELEWQLLEYLQKKYNIDHVSVERVVSGQGIVAIYQFLRDREFAPESPEISDKIRQWEKGDKTVDPAAIISSAAIKKSDRLCEKTMFMFVEAYGAETGNLALKIFPFGGIYIAGGIAAKILPLMQDGRFLETFKQKGRVSSVLEKIPIYIVLNPQVGLIGSVLFATNQV